MPHCGRAGMALSTTTPSHEHRRAWGAAGPRTQLVARGGTERERSHVETLVEIGEVIADKQPARINYSIIFFIVIFQHDIRRGLMRVGSNLFPTARHYEQTEVFEEIIKAAEQLANARVGGGV